jgi:thiamine-monophosphate kinase
VESKHLDETQIITTIRKAFNASLHRDRGLYDDASFIKLNGESLVIKADMFVASTDLLPGMNLRQASRKAVISSMSDMAAKGAEALYLIASLGIPRRISNDRSVGALVEGLKQASREFGVQLIGGDVNESKDFVIDSILVGKAGRTAERSGAKVGDVVAATGPFGYTGLALSHLLKGIRLPAELKEVCLKSVYEPSPNLEVAKSIVSSGFANASMDSSDGLALTLYEIAEQSNVAIRVSSLPLDEKLDKLDRKLIFDAALYGGEEFLTVLCIPKSVYSEAENLAKEKKGKLYKIGEVVKGNGVFITSDGGKSWSKLRKKGWTHLSK